MNRRTENDEVQAAGLEERVIKPKSSEHGLGRRRALMAIGAATAGATAGSLRHPGVAGAHVAGVGTLADRPPATPENEGDLYLVTDLGGGTLQLSSGSSWLTTGAPVDAGSSAIVAGVGDLSDRPAASAENAGDLYLVTDLHGGTLQLSSGTSWVETSAPVNAGSERPAVIDLSATSFLRTTGRPRLRASSSNAPAWMLRSGDAVEALLLPGVVPAWWSSITLTAWSYIGSPATSSVTLSSRVRAQGEGDSFNNNNIIHSGQDVSTQLGAIRREVIAHRLVEDLPIGSGNLLTIEVSRAADDYADQIFLLGVVLSRGV